VNFPQGTVLDGLSNIVTSGGTTKIQFPQPPATPSSRPTRTTDEDSASLGFSFVNEAGRAAMLAEGTRTYPAGTIIVRERVIPPSTTPDRLVMMIKHERSFNPKGNGWEFLTVDGAMTKVLGREKNSSCLKCHNRASQNDFVFAESKTQ